MLRITSPSVAQKLAAARQFIQAGRGQEAAAICREILAGDPCHPGASYVAALLAYQMNHDDDAERFIKQAIDQELANPDYVALLCLVLLRQKRTDELADASRRMTELLPNDPRAHFNLAHTMREGTAVAEKIACLERAIQLDPQLHVAHSTILNLLHFHPGLDGPAILARHQAWNRQVAEKLAVSSSQSFANDRSPERTLRIGYVSPDFRHHAIGRFMRPLFAHHDRAQCQVFAYSDAQPPDAMTDILRSLVHHWVPTRQLSDDQLAERIRADRIDILVDLTMHLMANRTLLFARRAAPVQATYLAYCSTTGLSTMDYRITDPFLDPPGGNNAESYCEKNAYIPSYWCYEAPAGAPPVGPPPHLRTGALTFGCLNNALKFSQPALEAWAAILQQVPASHLLLLAVSPRHETRLRDFFASRGIPRDRLVFSPFLPLEGYLARYHDIDIALDSFPHGGGTTSCDALYMGVPLVTFPGNTAVGRGGTSILSQIGLTELIAEDVAGYVQRAVALAGDQPRLARYRASRRQRMAGSPLMDAPAFVKSMEGAYRAMWRTWCIGQPPASVINASA